MDEIKYNRFYREKPHDDELSYGELAVTIDEMQASHDRIRAKIEALPPHVFDGETGMFLRREAVLDIVDYAGTD